MHQIACIDSEFIIHDVLYIGGKLRHPFRLYSNGQADIYVLECEAPILIQGIHSVLNIATRWCIDKDIKKVFVLEGYPVRGIPLPNRQPIILSSDNKKEQSEIRVNVGSREVQGRDIMTAKKEGNERDSLKMHS